MHSHLLITSITCLLALAITPSFAFFDGCPNPRQTELSYRGDGRGLPDVYRKLVSCPNISSLDLDMTLTGCVVYAEPWHFAFKTGDRFPALKKLSLSRYDLPGTDTGVIMPEYDWGYWAKQKAVDVLRATNILPSVVDAWDGELRQARPQGPRRKADRPPAETNLEKWLRAMDFTQIEELHLSQYDDTFYDRMANELPNIRSLSMFWSASTNHTAPANRIDFLRNIKPLEQLSIEIGGPYIYAEQKYHDLFGDRYQEEHRMRFPLDEILDTHCPSLTSLTLKQREYEIPSKRRPMLSLENITAIHQACPNLTSFEVDIDRDAESGWPLETFKALTKIESLTNLTLRLELGADLHAGDMGDYYWNPEGITDGGPFREPRMNRTAAEALFSYLHGQKKGQPLVNAVFEVGDYDEKLYMGPIYGPSWAEGRARKFVCEAAVAQRGGGGRYDSCRAVGDARRSLWYDEETEVKSAAQMWGPADDAAVDEYLAWMERGA